MNPVFAFLLAHWGLIITWLVVGTMATRVLDAIAKALPQFPRLTHFAAVVDEVVFDAIDIVVAVGKMIGGSVPPDLKGAAKNVAKGALVLLAAIAMVACSSLFHFTDGPTQAVTCDVTDAVLPEIEAAAAFCGPLAPACMALVTAIYGDACVAAAAKGQAAATQAGLDAIKAADMAEVKAKAQRLQSKIGAEGSAK